MDLVKKYRVMISLYNFNELYVTLKKDFDVLPLNEEILSFYREVCNNYKIGRKEIKIEEFYIVKKEV